MSLPPIDEATIRSHASPESYSRGAQYFAHGAVDELVLRGDTLQARVEGSDVEPYRVAVTFGAQGVAEASCTCPYDWGGWCKHVVAALLKAIHEPQAIERRPPLEDMVADLDRDQLQTLLLGIARQFPDAADEIDRRLALVRLVQAAPAEVAGTGAAPAAPRPTVDAGVIRRLVRAAMPRYERGSYDDYDYYDDEDPGGRMVDAVRPLLEQAHGLIAGGDSLGALALLDALTEAFLEGCRSLEDQLDEMYGLSIAEVSAGEFCGDLDEAWAEAVLSPELGRDERDLWGEKIAGFRDEAADLGVGEAFDIALTAAEQGWEYPPLRRVLEGQITELGAWDGESPEFADELALIRLRILERQGRHQEYLHLAEAEGQLDRYVAMLAKIGRTAEAVEEGLRYLRTPAEVQEVAKILYEQGDLEGAWRIAEHGLTLDAPARVVSYGVPGYTGKAELAEWATQLAVGMGRGERAVRAAEAAFRAAPSLNAYLKVQELAGAGWDTIKPRLLDQLRQSRSTEAQVDIFLQEGLFDDAIASVNNAYGYELLARVMAAVVVVRPEWVVQAATARAENIMDAGDAARCEEAVDWLRRAREGYQAADRADDWRDYMAGIRAKHARKRKLMGLLDK
jgi:uncharacterized Zn finger protein